MHQLDLFWKNRVKVIVFNIPRVDEGGRVGGIMCMGCGNENGLAVLFAVSIFFTISITGAIITVYC